MGSQDQQVCAFDFDNFHVWRLRAESTLVLHDLLEVVNGKEAKPDPACEVSVKKYEKRDSKARALILQTVQEMHLYIVRESQTAKEAWDSLCQAYERWAQKNWYTLQNRLYELKMREGESMHSHIQTFDTYVQHISVQAKMDEQTKALILLKSVPHSYSIAVERQAMAEKQTICLAYVIDSLLQLAEEYREKNKDAPSSAPCSGIIAAKRRCFYCNKPGHFEGNCWKKASDERNRV